MTPVVPGAGLYNAASGLTNADSRSTPVLIITGQIPRGAIGKNRGAVHKIANQAGVVSPSNQVAGVENGMRYRHRGVAGMRELICGSYAPETLYVYTRADTIFDYRGLG